MSRPARQGLYAASHACLAISEPADKCSAVAELTAEHGRGGLRVDSDYPAIPVGPPGRPDRPVLVDAAHVPRRRLGSPQGRAALVHAIAHIEFNAINLALDAVCRFRDMPAEYYRDWLSVALDESRHFRLVEQRLHALEMRYGDFPAHNGLWEMAEKTADSCLVRMALVPRVLEARGLDVTPGMIDRLTAAGDTETAAILKVILEEEVAHVAIGTRWFRYCCEREGREPAATFLSLLRSRNANLPRGPFNLEARYAAGFSRGEMKALLAGLG